MAVEYLGIDFTTRRELHRDPTWEAAESAIDLLGGEHVRKVRLATRAGTSLSIGGGEDGRYVVSGVRCSGDGTALRDGDGGGAEISKALVLKAAALFFRDGRFAAALSWSGAAAQGTVGARDA